MLSKQYCLSSSRLLLQYTFILHLRTQCHLSVLTHLGSKLNYISERDQWTWDISLLLPLMVCIYSSTLCITHKVICPEWNINVPISLSFFWYKVYIVHLNVRTYIPRMFSSGYWVQTVWAIFDSDPLNSQVLSTGYNVERDDKYPMFKKKTIFVFT